MKSYKIIRFFEGDRKKEVVDTGLTLKEAQEHCLDPATAGEGWFEGFEEESEAQYSKGFKWYWQDQND